MTITILISIITVCLLNVIPYKNNDNEELRSKIRATNLLRKRIDYMGNYKRKLHTYRKIEDSSDVKIPIDIKLCIGNDVEYDSIISLSMIGSFEDHYVLFLSIFENNETRNFLLTAESPYENSGNKCIETIDASNTDMQGYSEIFKRIGEYSELEKRPPHMFFDGFIVDIGKYYKASKYYYYFGINNPTLDQLPDLYRILIDLHKWSNEKYPNGHHDKLLKKYLNTT